MRQHERLANLHAAMAVGLAVCSSANGGDIGVPSQQPTIQAGINAAVNGDTVLVAPGNFNEAINFNGKAITVKSSGGAAVTTIDGTGLSASLVKFISNEGPGSILDGFTVSGSILASSSAGAGILASPANPTILNCRIFNNRVILDGKGGGVYQSGGQMLMVDCIIESNTASASCVARGGGMWSDSNPILINVKFHNNMVFVNQCPGGTGLGMGGGAYFAPGSGATLINCEFRKNRVHPNGQCSAGGVYRPTLMVNCLVADNSVGGGSSTSDAGVSGTAATTLLNCTIAGNQWLTGTGIGVAARAGVLHNCIVFSNNEPAVAGTSIISHSCIQGGFAGPGNIGGDPLFVNVAGQDYHLQDASPCRDTGDRTLLLADAQDLDGDSNTLETLSRDLGLVRRIVNGQVDMGAYEWQRQCLPDVSPSKPGVAGNGLIDIDDLLGIINGWGPCDQCVADVNDDNQVDIDDLLLVINGWGVCL